MVSKKFVFSAVAMMAFSSMSANTKELSKDNLENRTEKEQILIENRNCEAERLWIYAQAIRDGFTHNQASGMSYNFYFNCKREVSEIIFGN